MRRHFVLAKQIGRFRRRGRQRLDAVHVGRQCASPPPHRFCGVAFRSRTHRARLSTAPYGDKPPYAEAYGKELDRQKRRSLSLSVCLWSRVSLSALVFIFFFGCCCCSIVENMVGNGSTVYLAFFHSSFARSFYQDVVVNDEEKRFGGVFRRSLFLLRVVLCKPASLPDTCVATSSFSSNWRRTAIRRANWASRFSFRSWSRKRQAIHPRRRSRTR